MTLHDKKSLLFKRQPFQVKAMANVLFCFFDTAKVTYNPLDKRFSVSCEDVSSLSILQLNMLNALIRRFSVADYIDNNNLNILCL